MKALKWRLRLQQPTNSGNTRGQGGGFWAVALFLLWAAPAAAQIVPFTDVAGYNVARVTGQNLCVAATDLRSQSGRGMVYSYYQTMAGQRWHVAGYASNEQLTDGEAAVVVSIDGEVTLDRVTEARDGDFMLPFATLAEIEGHEARVRDGSVMRIAINGDHLDVPLAEYRAALAALTACLNSF